MDAHTEPTDAMEQREREIALRAYELYEARGGEPGHDQEDWFEAERQLIEEGVISPRRPALSVVATG